MQKWIIHTSSELVCDDVSMIHGLIVDDFDISVMLRE